MRDVAWGAGWRAWAGWRGVLTMGGIVALLGVGYLCLRLAAVPSAAERVAAEARAAQAKAPIAADVGAAPRTVVVFVSGAVAHPGMYRLAAGLRVSDALAAAGGVLPDADPDRLPDLAGKLTDGKQVKVARRTRASSGVTGATRVDINSATAAELEAVPGVDAALAEAVVAYRDSFGPYASVTDLKAALGLDSQTIAQLRRYLTAL